MRFSRGQVGLAVLLLLANSNLGCSPMVTATAGPVFSWVPGSGFGIGWSINGGVSGLLDSSNSGYGVTLGIGQSWRPNRAWHPHTPLRTNASPGEAGQWIHNDEYGSAWVPSNGEATPSATSFEPGTEMLTYFDFGLNATLLDALPSYGQLGLAVGPAWSSENPTLAAGLMADFSPSLAFVPGSIAWPSCSRATLLAPTFVAILGIRWLHGSFEVYLSPQAGVVWEDLNTECFAISGNYGP